MAKKWYGGTTMRRREFNPLAGFKFFSGFIEKDAAMFFIERFNG
jgi:hypothetical protein